MNDCKHCGCSHLVESVCGPHIGLYCADCGKWHSWKKQNPETGEEASESQERYAIKCLQGFKAKRIRMTAKQAGAIISTFGMHYE